MTSTALTDAAHNLSAALARLRTQTAHDAAALHSSTATSRALSARCHDLASALASVTADLETVRADARHAHEALARIHAVATGGDEIEAGEQFAPAVVDDLVRRTAASLAAGERDRVLVVELESKCARLGGEVEVERDAAVKARSELEAIRKEREGDEAAWRAEKACLEATVTQLRQQNAILTDERTRLLLSLDKYGPGWTDRVLDQQRAASADIRQIRSALAINRTEPSPRISTHDWTRSSASVGSAATVPGTSHSTTRSTGHLSAASTRALVGQARMRFGS
ncbi:hypothetical protein AMAG_04624 [Allomyces macrogynus ATCC 38327]|uniref:Uncharacterized protein n=1 Tax=Allomyces macrogynus (strain ATCC 38327) TaxID=578462 RepID=A0A0L0S5S8_ALLM3|nr:hypothetical protein AMAG_04624 [Allomyces macrogynus ATCC 38327]|eukprot:KNE57771.1 hypothetical protein AMAG_04624 [Allomyces macrogynus ATCC 38327]